MQFMRSLLFLGQFLLVGSQATSYDYIIIGGGTAGLTIASRLTENPKTSVIVLEAGNDHSDDLTVLAPGLFPAMYGNPEYDWNYQTVSQVFANSQVVAHPRGKQLGGSSAINFMFWTHPSQRDIDNWGALGNSGWSWDALHPYFKKSESYVAPSEQVNRDLLTQYIQPSVHGKIGPIRNTFPDSYSPVTKAWPRTYQNLGIAVNGDPRAGLALGGYTNLINVDLKTHTRSYAGTAYYRPFKARPNLTVITGAHVEKVLTKRSRNGVRATGAQYSTSTSASIQVSAKQEVILSAGTIGSPQILELSGIGNPTLLRKHGIEVVVPNANVGENLQDHIYVPIGYQVVPGIATNDNFTDPVYFDAALKQYLANATGPISTAGASSSVLSCAQIGCSNLKLPSSDAKLTSGLAAQHALQIRHFHSEAVTQELTVGGGMSPQFPNDTTKLFSTSLKGNFYTLLGVLEHPFSRGSSHIKSSNATTYPEIDPRYLSHPFDLAVLRQIALHLDNVIAKTAPLSDYFRGNGTVYQPGYHALNEANVADWIKTSFQSEYHPIGTCSLLPEEKGGVVDEKLNVYGVRGLRVVDASVFPLMPRANIQTLVYAVAERAADWIKESRRE